MKVRTIKKIKFWSLRPGIGTDLGFIFDEDTEVTRLCRLVLVESGLKWQLVKNNYYKCSYYNEEDQECLNETNYEDVKIINEPMFKWSINGSRGQSINNPPF